MPRLIDAAVVAETQAEVYRRAHIASIDYPSDPVFVAQTSFDVTASLDHDWDGTPTQLNFNGIGEFGGIGAPEESGAHQVQQLDLTLSGIPIGEPGNSDLLAKYLSDAY